MQEEKRWRQNSTILASLPMTMSKRWIGIRWAWRLLAPIEVPDRAVGDAWAAR
jgi:hypothetical protein